MTTKTPTHTGSSTEHQASANILNVGSDATPEPISAASDDSPQLSSSDARAHEAYEVFEKYFVRNYPGPDTVIFDPKWHAPKIFRVALQAISGAASMLLTVPCPCTTYEQDEDCPVGSPSLVCSACEGKGEARIETVVALAAEMLKVAEQVDDLEDPFAAWESIELLKSATPLIPASDIAAPSENAEAELSYQCDACSTSGYAPTTACRCSPSLSDKAEGTIANALAMTGCKNEEDLIDMANVGRSLMEAIDFFTRSPSLLENWSPAESPVEIVGDLYDRLEESLACHRQAMDEAKAAAAIIAQIEAIFPNWRAYRDLVDCVDSSLPLISPAGFRWIDRPITVTGGDYQYAGQLLCSFPKAPGGAVRYIVRDGNNRLFIHNAQQCGLEAS